MVGMTHGRVASPANGIFAGGPYGVEGKREGISADAGTIRPGAALMTSSTDGSVIEATGPTVGLVGIAAENLLDGVESFLTAHANAAMLPYYSPTPGLQFFGIVKNSSAALIYGDKLQMADNGEWEKFAVDTTNAGTVASSVGVALARYIDVADLTPASSGVNRVLMELI